MTERGEFTKLLAAAFVSQCGSHFLTLALAAYVFETTGSLLAGSSVFVLSYLPAVLVGGTVGAFVDANIRRRLLVFGEIVAIAASALCVACLAYALPFPVLCVGLALRSVLLLFGRSAYAKWIKEITPAPLQAPRIKIYFLTFFLSTAVSGLLAASVLGIRSLPLIFAIDAGTYALGALVLLSLVDLPARLVEKPTRAPTSVLALAQSLLAQEWSRRDFITVCASQATFQGAYFVLVSYLPVRALSLGVEGVGKFQLAASIGITLGFVLNWLFPNSTRDGRLFAAVTGTLLALACSAVSRSLPVSLVSFFVLNLGYELVWLHATGEFFRKAPVDRVAAYQFTLNSVAALLMSLATLAYAFSITTWGSAIGIGVTLLFFAAVSLLLRPAARLESVR